MKKILIATILFLSLAGLAKAQSVLYPLDGGTGFGSADAGDVGTCLKVSNDDPFTYELGTCGGGASDIWQLLDGDIQATTTNAGYGVKVDYFTATSTTATSTFAGSVGIGTTTPGVKFASGSALSSPIFSVISQSAGDGLVVDGTSSNSPQFSLSNNSLQRSAYGFATTNGHFSGGIALAGDTVLRALNGASDDRLILTNQQGGDIIFGTGTTNSNDTIKMIVKADGDIGIGTTTPWADYRLNIVPQRAGDGIMIDAGQTNNSPHIALCSDGACTNSYGLALNDTNFSAVSTVGDVVYRTANGDGDLIFSNQHSGNLYWATGGTSLTDTTKMTLLADGKLGIGTTTPDYPVSIFSNSTPQLSLTAGAGLRQWTWRGMGNSLSLSPTDVAGTSITTAEVRYDYSDWPSLSVGSTTADVILTLGADSDTSASSTIKFTENIQLDGKDTATGDLTCAYIANGAWVIETNPCKE